MFEQRASEIAAAAFPNGEPSLTIARLSAPLILALMCLETGELVKAQHWVKLAQTYLDDMGIYPDD